MKLRYRITYTVDSPFRYAAHLDQARAWERAVRRAGLPLAYSAGFTPHPRIQIAAALPVGFAGREELLDLWLERPVAPVAAQEALARSVPAGLTVLRVEEADPSEPPLPTQVWAAEYAVSVETDEPGGEIARRIEDLLAAESLPRQRRDRSYDLRPLVERLWVEEERPGELTLGMRLAAREGATGRPEEVWDALELTHSLRYVCRLRLVLAPSLQDEICASA